MLKEIVIELGRIDIYTETALLSQHLALPRVGHLETVYHVFSYISRHEKSSIIFDPTDPLPNTPTRAKADWSSFYSDLEEELPPKMPEPRLGHPVNIYTFVDANRTAFTHWDPSFSAKLTYCLAQPTTEHD